MVHNKPIKSIAECYARALAIEHEAVTRYREFADILEAKGASEAATMFREVARLDAEHEDSLRRKVKGIDLPKLEEWEVSWLDDAPPEKVSHEVVYHLMTLHGALKIAEEAERSAHDFFARMQQTSGNPEVRTLAAEMASEGVDHLVRIHHLIEKTPRPFSRENLAPGTVLG